MAFFTRPSKLITLSVIISTLRSHFGLSPIFLEALAGADFAWHTLAATDTLVWTACYDGFECTRLNVPLDYASPSTGNATVAITRLPSTAPKSKYRGPILLNPGGPGGSGVDYVVESGASIATILGDGFDLLRIPGVSYSTPMVSFFKTDAERALWTPAATNTMYPSLNESSNAVAEQWARAQIQGRLAEARNDNFQYMTTDNAARDMLRITEAFGWDKLQYWGVSYGSVLGSTFAALFPDKVGRVVIDGVLDMASWYSANLTSEMVDTDKALQTFIDRCFAAGPDDCAFYANSSAQISANLDALSASIKGDPLPVITPLSYGIVGYTFLRNFIFDSFYSPYDLFVPLAQSLADLAAGNATTMYAATEIAPFECECNATGTAIPFHENNYEAGLTIACGDATAVNDTVATLQTFEDDERTVSGFADLWGNWRIVCSGWKLHRKGRFSGPFGAANVSFPLLVIGNTVDHVTPIWGANKTANAFPGSVLLTLDTVGHTSLAAPSTCIYAHLRAYFVNGTLPAAGTVCSPDGVLFPSSNGTDVSSRELGSREELLQAGRIIGRAARRVTGGRMPF
ncbi:TAP-like protein-domain-containing protein [Mycena epipterygia]|nr:TAP-like protein-domain-containing protein [Mycena epipterygia]